MPTPVVVVSDSCLLGAQPLAAFLRRWARGCADEQRLDACLRAAEAQYARGSDPQAVAAELLALLPPHTDSEVWATLRKNASFLTSLRRRHGARVLLLTELPQPHPAVGDLCGITVTIVGSHPPHDAMVGERRVATLAADVALEHCVGFGCAPTDLPLLRALGAPVVVGAHPTLVRAAVESGWARLAAPRRSPVGPAELRVRAVPSSVDETALSGRP